MEYFQLIVSAIVCYLISTLIHELGHIIYGLLNHWKLFMLVVGPVKFYRKSIEAKIKIGIEKNLTLWCGAGGTLPPYKSDENFKTWANILIAGPIASIIFSVMMLPLFIVHKTFFTLLLCLMPLAMGIMCLLPLKMKTGLLYNDGTRYRRIKSAGPEALEEKAIFQLMEITMFEGLSALYPQELIDPLLHSKDYEFNYYGYYYSYINAKNNGNLNEADMQLSNMKKIKDKVPKLIIDDCKIDEQSKTL